MRTEIRSVIDFFERHPISREIILTKLKASRGHLDHVSPEELFPHDQDHYGGLDANDALAARPLPDSSVDAVISQEALLHVPDKGRTLAEAKQRLAMYRKLREEARQAGTPAGHDAFYESYVRLVELVSAAVLGGGRISGEKPR